MADKHTKNKNNKQEKCIRIDKKQTKKKYNQTTLNIKYGCPIILITWNKIQMIIYFACLLNAFCLVCDFALYISAVKTKSHIGNYLNMVTNNEGAVLPMLLGFCGIVCFPLNASFILLINMSRKKKKRQLVNNFLFFNIIISAIIIKIIFGMAMGAAIHTYSLQNRISDGIIDAMKIYKSNTEIKSRIDALQIKYQCCGSQSYKEWFDIPWYRTDLNGV